ncbi:MAG: hypothetical protein JSS57_17305 [Proteobacteria bacterium]|nr:hypothetical protein [Pseudomonadota bacterium]
MKRLLLLAALTPLLTACVGAGVISSQTETPKRATLAKSRGNIVLLAPNTSAPTTDKTAVRKGWGEPDRIEPRGELERWIYNKDVAWTGVLLFAVIVPIPLLVPVGHDHLAIDFRNDVLVNIEARGQESRLAFCAMPLLIPHANGCEAATAPADGGIGKQFIDPNGTPLVEIDPKH